MWSLFFYSFDNNLKADISQIKGNTAQSCYRMLAGMAVFGLVNQPH